MNLSAHTRRRARVAGPLAAVAVLAMGLPSAAAEGASPAPVPPPPAATQEPSSRVTVVTTDEDGAPQVEVVQAASVADARRLAASTEARPEVVAAEVDMRVAALDHPRADDPRRAEQWNMDRVEAEHFWSRSRGAGVLVAVIDSGVDASHPDLTGAVVPGVDYVDDGGDGRIDPDGHGTHVAGTIAARSGDGVGVVGVAPDVDVLPMRVLDANGEGFTSDVTSAIYDSVDRGARVLNLSLGNNTPSETVAAAIDYATSAGVLVVAAAGNQGLEGDPVSYPAAEDGVLAVAATTTTDAPAGFSTAGDYVDVAAPGEGVLSTYPASTWVTFSGTSMAAPHVAGAAAALFSAAPGLTGADATAALTSTAQDVAAPGVDDETGHGVVDPAAALSRVIPTPDPAGATVVSADVDGDGRAEVGWFSDGLWLFRTDTGPVTFRYGRGTDVPVTGDWDGDGRDGIAVFRDGRYFLRQTVSGGPAYASVSFGRAGDRPVTGAWTGSARDGIGIVRGNTWHLRTTADDGPAGIVARMGRADDVPVPGDWAGDGTTRPGVFRSGRWHLAASASDTTARWSYGFGRASDRPLAADVDGDRVEAPAVARDDVVHARHGNGASTATTVVGFPG